MAVVILDLSDFDEDRSTLLADQTMEAGLQNCHERAALALERAPKEWRARFTYAAACSTQPILS